MRIISCFVVMFFLSGCAPTLNEIERDEEVDVQSIVKSMRFVKHPNGLCFGVVMSDSIALRMSVHRSIAIVPVDCGMVGL